MDNSSRIDSVFDKFEKIKNASASFGWKVRDSSHKFDSSKILFSENLQEIDPVKSIVYSVKKYAVTPNEILRFSVSFNLIFRITKWKNLNVFSIFHFLEWNSSETVFNGNMASV